MQWRWSALLLNAQVWELLEPSALGSSALHLLVRPLPGESRLDRIVLDEEGCPSGRGRWDWHEAHAIRNLSQCSQQPLQLGLLRLLVGELLARAFKHGRRGLAHEGLVAESRLRAGDVFGDRFEFLL